MAALQISAGLSAPRIFQKKPAQPRTAPQHPSFAFAKHRQSFRVNQFAFNPFRKSEDLPQHFVRPDCPPDTPEKPSPKGFTKDVTDTEAYNFNKYSPRSPLEKVSFYTNEQRWLQSEKRKAKNNKWGIFGF